MTDQSLPFRQPLGIGTILGDSFAWFFSGFFRLMAIILIPSVLLSLGQSFLMSRIETGGFDGSLGALGLFGVLPAEFWLIMLMNLTVSVVIWGAATLGIQDRIKGQSSGVASYFLTPLLKLPQIVVLTLLVIFAFLLSYLLLGLAAPALADSGIVAILGIVGWLVLFFYLMAAYNPLLPVILIDKAGWRSLGRTLDLTRGYRWPIAAVLLVYVLIMALVLLILGLAAGSLGVLFLNGNFDSSFTVIGLAMQVVSALSTSVIIGFSVTFTVVIFNRLVAIKEGPVADDLERVFQ